MKHRIDDGIFTWGTVFSTSLTNENMQHEKTQSLSSIFAWWVTHAYLQGFSCVSHVRCEDVWKATEGVWLWYHQNMAAEMDWWSSTKDVRMNMKKRWKDAETALIFLAQYPVLFSSTAISPARGKISSYALQTDYHRVMGRRLKRLCRWARRRWSQFWFFPYVDTGPVPEKILGQLSGIGWIGKHGNLIHPEFGSWVFLGIVLTNCALENVRPQTFGTIRCGTCQACMDICPTRAIRAPGVVDARRCISYWTIEHHGPIPPEVRKGIGTYLFGCDDCQVVCPWNRKAWNADFFQTHIRYDLASLSYDTLLFLTEDEFHTRFSGTPVLRLGLWRLKRNCLIALGNSGQDSFRDIIRRFLEETDDPILYEHAQWALKQLQNRSHGE